jgi:hypothetical protein
MAGCAPGEIPDSDGGVVPDHGDASANLVCPTGTSELQAQLLATRCAGAGCHARCPASAARRIGRRQMHRIDVHARNCTFAVMDGSGKRMRQHAVETNGQAPVKLQHLGKHDAWIRRPPSRARRRAGARRTLAP